MRWTLLGLCLLATTALGQTPKAFPPAPRTAWAPIGCRTPDAGGSPLASRATWRSLHSDEVNTDEVGVAYAPSFVADWVAEPNTWNPTGPVFDDAGNLYFVPLFPYEPVVLISLDPVTGARRWSIPRTTPAPVGSGSPLVLDDPDNPGEQIIYVGLYDRALAVRQDGSIVWDVATGLPGGPAGVFGVNHHPGADAIVGLAGNGWIYALDRRTGAPILTAPFQLPGTVSPPGIPLAAPPAVQACASAELATLADTGGRPIQEIVDVLLGNGVEVANYFSIAPNTGRLWVAATAPDGDDGAVDGVSQLGALYGIDLVPSGPLWTVTEACRRPFAGGSASTPALRRDGSRVYVGDNVGNLIAIDDACNDIWSLPVGGQITGSIGVASDNGEVYASTATTIHQVIDAGATASIAWSADLDVFDLGAGQVIFNQNLAGIGANGIAFQAGAGILLGTTRLTITTGMGILDRLTGKVRHFAGGLDETVAVMSSGPDGALYIGNSPIRRPFTKCLADLGFLPGVAVPDLVGGIRKWTPTRLDLLLRDVGCAGADRARNARRQRKVCADSVADDQVQLAQLAAQGRGAAGAALASGDITAAEKTRVDRWLDRVQRKQSLGRIPSGPFRGMCRYFARTRP
jgi:outer membrane protein assembly factor BamB